MGPWDWVEGEARSQPLGQILTPLLSSLTQCCSDGATSFGGADPCRYIGTTTVLTRVKGMNFP